MSDLIGKTVGRYRIVAQIGRGGMATVYKAYQPGLDRHVAVKVLPPYYAQEEGFVERFKQEARAVARLRHPNILTVYDFGEADGLTYIVMEFVESGTLKDRLGRSLPLDRVIELAIQVGQALGYAHSEGIIHRDIKPSNILLPRDDWALLSDFGIAKVVESTLGLTKTGVGIGTPEYMSPEQGQGLSLDGRSDIYSLGVMLYEMVTGRVPFSADTPFAVVIKHMTEPLPPPSQINPNLPESVERLILKAMAKEPEDRYQTAGQMVQALEAIHTGAGAGAPQTTPKRRAKRSPRRTPADPTVLAPPKAERRGFNLLWLAVPILLLLLVGGGFLALSSLRSSPEATPTISQALAVTDSTATPVPTLTRILTSTPVPTRAPTEAPTSEQAQVAATATLEPTSLPVVEATATLRPTSTSPVVPTATLEPTDSPSAPPPTTTLRTTGVTAAPRPQPTAVQGSYPAPVLVEPSHESRFNGGQIWLRWEWDGQLGPDEHFDVRMWQGGQPHQGIAWTKESQYLLNLDILGEAWYHWSVAVIRGRNGQWEADLSPEAEERAFYRSGGPPPETEDTPVPAPTRPP